MTGYTQIQNSFVEQLYSQNNLSSLDIRILLFVFRKTIGWGKESDKISLSQFVKSTNSSKRAIINSVERLVQLKALVRMKDSGRTNTYRLVKSSSLVQSKVWTSAVEGKKLVKSTSHTKDTTKETIQKGIKISSEGLQLDPSTDLVKRV